MFMLQYEIIYRLRLFLLRVFCLRRVVLPFFFRLFQCDRHKLAFGWVERYCNRRLQAVSFQNQNHIPEPSSFRSDCRSWTLLLHRATTP